MQRDASGLLQLIDNKAVQGLSGTVDSLSYKVAEIERHLHNYERSFVAAAAPNAEIHVADRICSGGSQFRVDAGNNTWGAWLQILGSSDTPAIAGMVKYDLHRITFFDHERNNMEHCIQIAFGASGDAALTAETYTEFSFQSGGGNSESSPVLTKARRQDVGTKAWIRIGIPGQNTGWLDFAIVIHEYEG